MMSSKSKRTILSAMFAGEIGPLTSDQLTGLQKHEWQHLRQQITDFRRQGSGLEATCMACGSHVYISCRDLKGVKLPFYSHYSAEASQSCPWYQGKNLRPTDARALQYAGQQESMLHRMMCEKIEEIVKLDPRYLSSQVDVYLPPSKNSFGRYPDVYFELEDLGKYVIEFQKSKTFQTEISDRIGHYQRENIPIIWVLFGLEFDRNICQSFSDVIQRHRGNAFVLDGAAIEKSMNENKLYLTCYLQNKENYDPPIQVSLDQLTTPSTIVPYYEDRIAEPMCETFRLRRAPIYKALKNWSDYGGVTDEISDTLSRLPVVPPIDLAFIKCIATIFSIVLHGLGRNEILVTNCQNIKAMINSLCQGQDYTRYSKLLKEVLKHSSFDYLLNEKVGEHLSRNTTDLIDKNSPQWQLVQYLFPELLDSIKRQTLEDLEALPVWAIPQDS